MNRIVCFLFFFVSIISAKAQIAGIGTALATTYKAPKNGAAINMNAEKEDNHYVYRHPQRLSALYTGFAIEVIEVRMPLEGNDPLFRQFGNLFYEKKGRGKAYSYIFPTNFEDRKNLDRYLKEVVLPKAPNAKLVEYEGGRRL
jgi:hypothetical protein